MLSTPPAFILSQDQTLRKLRNSTRTEDSSSIPPEFLQQSSVLPTDSVPYSLLGVVRNPVSQNTQKHSNHQNRTQLLASYLTTLQLLMCHRLLLLTLSLVLPLLPRSSATHSCRPQSASPNFTTAPSPCQIRQALFLQRLPQNLYILKGALCD